jgi:hypothetical protein
MHTLQYAVFVNGLAQSGVGKSRKCCFQHRYQILPVQGSSVSSKNCTIVSLPNEELGRIDKRFEKKKCGFFEALFNGVSTRFWKRTIKMALEKSIDRSD